MHTKVPENTREIEPEMLQKISGGINIRGLISTILDYVRNPLQPFVN